ncbi:hypothetical protein H6F90_14595 [Trichocoleus sp. FACHB-591]|uniref:hypothetical protein n=1 Tax=unclassified Trichocoleus TaxID=2628910 RepID=UPI0016889813|nr:MULTISPECIES: hypothetical protein [unclassified Trichocoleus]MBD2096369.1 hypothetical protein [Trichocoleus sp. FACHB-591]MBD2121808.1 hypothetical protein [Trichocoleus sp. FACHB-262]
MSTKTQVVLYSIYIEQSAVVLYLDNESDYGTGRFVSSQADYQVAYNFALELAQQKGLKLINYVEEFS